MKKILGLGHPRTGTGFTAQLLKNCNLDVGHEVMGRDGIVSWQFATKSDEPLFMMSPNLRCNNFIFETIIYNTRNPKYSIPSIIYTENKSINFRQKFIDLNLSDNQLSLAIQSILGWDALILKNYQIHFTYRIEDQFLNLISFLSTKYNILEPNKIPINYNSRSHKYWDDLIDLIPQVNSSLLKQMNIYCLKYGYKPIFDLSGKTLIL